VARRGARPRGSALVTPQAFGEKLRRHREKRRITLHEIARQTKVSAGLFESLENGECARWPGGIYGRGFVRAYATAIGLDPEQVVAVFGECYPQFASDAAADPAPDAEEAPPTALAKLKGAVAAWFRIVADMRR
jgi:cytoskeletal protein RodZ